MITAIFCKLMGFIFAPIVVFFDEKDKILHFYVAYAMAFFGSWFWNAYWATMITILAFIFKEEIYDRLLRRGHYDPMDLRWSLVGVLHSMFLFNVLVGTGVIRI